MANQWISSVKDTHQLNYYLNSVTGLWRTAVQDAIREFNALSARHSLGVTYVQSSDPPTDTGGADISEGTVLVFDRKAVPCWSAVRGDPPRKASCSCPISP